MSRLTQKINDNDVYFIAEMSANHGGSIENALEIVREVAKAGADCLKIQTYTADTLTIDCDAPCFKIQGGLWDGYKLYDLYKNAFTPWEWQPLIKKECEKAGIDFLSTPFDNTSVDFLEQMGCEAYKIASFELVDIPLIKYAASKGKPMIISTGMGSIEEIEEAVNACHSVGNNKIALLKCTSEYPANWADMHLGNISDMKERFGVPIGISDHSPGSIGPIVGATLGACIVEKHVKLDGVDSADSKFSMTIDEFGKMISDVKIAKLIAQGPNYSLTKGEKASLKFRRSLFSVKDIKRGESFTRDNIRSIRPSDGIKPKYYEEIIGKKAKRDIKYGEPIQDDMY